MDSNLENAMRIASEAFLNVAEEARKLKDEILQLRAQVERHAHSNHSLNPLLHTYYAGQG